MRHHDPNVRYQREAQCYIVTWLHNNFCNASHDPLFFAVEGQRFWELILDGLCTTTNDKCLTSGNVKCWMQMNYVRWDEPMIGGDPSSHQIKDD